MVLRMTLTGGRKLARVGGSDTALGFGLRNDSICLWPNIAVDEVSSKQG